MRLTITACVLAIITIALQSVEIVAKSAVGLYAPDRYDGIPDMCLMPMDFGYCRAKVKRYYFDMRRMKCTMFFWGGCAGNNNNFKSLEECNKICFEAIEDQNNSFGSNANAPTSVYTPNNARNTPPLAKKYHSNSNLPIAKDVNTNSNNNSVKRIINDISNTNNGSNINTSLYANQNFNKYKINRNFDISKDTKDSIDDTEEDEDYEAET